MRVMIIGGGTGGMCLAHGLRKAGIDVTVYERYGHRTDGLYGYRVGIDPTGSQALWECLSRELFDIFVATCARPPEHFNVLTESMTQTASIPLSNDPEAIASERSVSRATLRQVLFSGFDALEFGKEFTHYESHPDGTVTAFFADGTSATGDLLVGADGTRSAVRAQFLPEATIRDTGITAIATKTPLTDETRALLSPEVADGLSLIFADKGMLGILHVMEFPWDADGNPKDARFADQIRAWPDLVYDNTRDYINLAIWSSHEHFPAGTADLRGGELIKVALDATATWDERFRRLFELADPASAFPLRIATSDPVPAWKPTNITLMGDAIHTMTPGQGVGANTALRDAAILSRELIKAHTKTKSLDDAVGDYEAEMLPYGTARVAASLDSNGTSAGDPLYKPGLAGRTALFVTRSYFSLTSKIPALRRKFLRDLENHRAPDLPES